MDESAPAVTNFFANMCEAVPNMVKRKKRRRSTKWIHQLNENLIRGVCEFL